MKRKLELKEILQRFKDVHGDKYDYSKVVYDGVKTKVCIICPKHGEFWMTPVNHMFGKQGCPKCGIEANANKRRFSQETFIKKERETHGDKYDLSKANYTGIDDKVCIICHEKDENGVEHGEFWQTAYEHLKGAGCPKCAHNLPYTTETYIQACIKKHGNKFLYDKVVYKSIFEKVCIGCKKHGYFQISASGHLHGTGCPKCAGKHKTTKDFIDESNEVHGNKYDYSKSEYRGAFVKTCIICHEKDENGVEHGEFWQTAHTHLRGSGCPKCAIDATVKRCRKSLDKFKDDVEAIYGKGFFDLSNVVYKNAHTPVCISYPERGEFFVTPNMLLSGRGTKLYKESCLEREVRVFFENLNNNLEHEKTFKWLKYKGYMRLDFYDEKTNIAIECQGIQHFVPLRRYRNTYSFDEQLIKDELKYRLCQENNVKVIYYTRPEYEKYIKVSKIYSNNTFFNLEDLRKQLGI